MKERPIIFNSEMVQAILDKRKSQTRRPQGLDDVNNYFSWASEEGYTVKSLEYKGFAPSDYYIKDKKGYAKNPHLFHWFLGEVERKEEKFYMMNPIPVKCPFGVVGDRLWVKETWATEAFYDNEKPSNLNHGLQEWYKATKETWDKKYCCVSELYTRGKTRSSIHMPRWASRILLEIVNIRPEPVQEISIDDIYAEGCPIKTCSDEDGSEIYQWFFEDVWDAIYGKKYPAESNPWVWVIEFERIESK